MKFDRASLDLPRLRAIPFFIPGWLYIPILLLEIRLLPRSINENVLALLLQLPLVMGVLAVWIAIRLDWTTGRQSLNWVLFPSGLLALIYAAMIPD